MLYGGSKTEMLRNSPSYRRLVGDLVTSVGGHAHLALVPDGSMAPPSNPVLDGLPRMTNTYQLQKPVVDPVVYFTDRLIRDHHPTQPSWWADLRVTATQHPGQLLYTILSGMIQVTRYVGWNYVDFVDQIRSWDGTWLGLVRHTELIWRTLVTVLLTAGLIQAGPLLWLLTEWLELMGGAMVAFFRVLGSATDVIWRTVDDIVSYLWDTVQNLFDAM